MKKDIKRQDEAFNDSEDGEGTGTQTGEIAFRYADVLSGEPRDDVLPSAEEERRLLSSHKEIHKGRVDQQKYTRKKREAAKENQTDLISSIYNDQKYRATGSGGAQRSHYKTHPVAIKFPGVNPNPLSPPETNIDKQQELALRMSPTPQQDLQLQQRYTQTPKPRPS